MWSYYGSKANVIHKYPAPKCKKIIEPFAGTARYALRFYDRDVLLVDKYEVIVKIWQWLQRAKPEDILKLPRLKEAERVSDYQYDSEEAALLLGFLAGRGVERPRDKASSRATTHRPKNMNYQLNKIANNLWKIRHWEIVCGDYRDIPNQEATWFIDPPYQYGGYVYAENNTGWDYSELAEWCKSREGHVIVCENMKATWLPFVPVQKQRGSLHTTTEAVWSNYHIPYQLGLWEQPTDQLRQMIYKTKGDDDDE